MSGHTVEEVEAEKRKYLMVFGALLVGTLVTVGAYYVHFSSVVTTVTVALIIASIKGFLVAGYFMHLVDEKKTIYTILIFTVFFFIGMMALTLWASNDFPVTTIEP